LSINIENLDKHGSKRKHDASTLSDKMSSALVRMDMLLKENFELKREIVFQRKKYVDIHQSYHDLKNSMQQLDSFELS